MATSSPAAISKYVSWRWPCFSWSATNWLLTIEVATKYIFLLVLRSRHIVTSTVKAAPHKFSYLLTYSILIKIILNVVTKMSDFNAKMHQIRFWLGRRPRLTGELTALPWPSSWWEGDWLPFSKSSQCLEAVKYVLRPIILHCTSKCTFVRLSAEFEPQGPFVSTALPNH